MSEEAIQSDSAASAAQAPAVEGSAPAGPVAPAFPETAAGYEIRLPEKFQFPEGYSAPDPENPLNIDDPRFAAARELAHANKLTQSQFEGMVSLGIQLEAQEQVQLHQALAEQAKLLGSKGHQRVQAVTQWLGAKLGGDKAQALAAMLFTAKQVEAFEELMRLNRGVLPGNPGGGRDPSGPIEMSDEEWARMPERDRIMYARQFTKR